MKEAERVVKIKSHGVDITSIFPEEYSLVKKIMPLGCPSNEPIIEFRYLQNSYSYPVKFTGVCTNVVRDSDVCRHCILNQNHANRLDFDL